MLQKVETLEGISGPFPVLQVKQVDAVPEAFQIVLSYIYTDKIDPSPYKKDPDPNKIVLIMMDVYRLAVQVGLIFLFLRLNSG